MGKFLTAHSRLQQLDIPGKWKTVDNQIYENDFGQLFLCPRNTITDGYTIPSIFSVIAGDKMKWDTRASSQHDFECLYHKYIQILLTSKELSNMGLLHSLDSMIVCEDIPKEYLMIRETTFNETNTRFLNMLQSFQTIPKWRAKLMGYAVNLNAGWVMKPHHYDRNMIYFTDYSVLGK